MKHLFVILFACCFAITAQHDSGSTQTDPEVITELEQFLERKCRLLRIVKWITCWNRLPACYLLIHAVDYCTHHRHDVETLLFLLNKRRCRRIEKTVGRLCWYNNPLCTVLKRLKSFCQRLHEPQTTTTEKTTPHTTTMTPTSTTSQTTTIPTSSTTTTTEATTTTQEPQECTSPNSCLIANCSPENLRPQFTCPPGLFACCKI